MSLILASASLARRQVLAGAGLVFEVDPARVDEDGAKAAMRAEGLNLHAQADALAALKAVSVSGRRGGLVIGADQMLAIEGENFDKPRDREEARAQLKRLRGRTHELIAAVAVAREGAVLWRHIETPRLHMRDFSDAFLEHYLDQGGEGLLACVGAYRLEGLGAQLFERVEGDCFSVLGLPLLPLLAFLRQHGAAPT